MAEKSEELTRQRLNKPHAKENDSGVCPVCGSKLIQEKCKVVCRSKTCVYRIIYNCSEF